MKFESYWREEFPYPEVVSLKNLPSSADVVVVGSGYTGLNAALAIAKAGLSVIVLEQNTLAWGASSRSGAMLTPGLKAKLKNISKWYGEEKTAFFWQWSVDAVHHVSNLVHNEKIDCDYMLNGMAYLASKESHAEAVRDYGQYLSKTFNYNNTAWVSKENIRDEIGSDAFFGALIDSLGSRLQPAKYVFGLAKTAINYGAGIVENAAVQKIRTKPSGWELQTAKGSINAGQVLIATGGYTSNLVPKVRSGIFPVGSYIIVTEPLTNAMQKDLSPKDRVFYDSNIFLNYFSLTTDGRMMFGGRANLSPNLDLKASAVYLQTRMLEVFPQLKGVPISNSWTGRLGISFDQMPHIGQAGGIYYAYGYSGHGISIGSYLGKEVGELMTGQRDNSAFMEIRHPRSIFSRLDRFYLPVVSAYFRYRDAKS